MNSSYIRVLAIGDVVGRPGRQCLDDYLPQVKADHKPDLIIANAENISGGFGTAEKDFLFLTESHGIQVVTSGNHWDDKKEIHTYGSKFKNLLIPANLFQNKSISQGYFIGKLSSGVSYAVINLMGILFMKDQSSCPFQAADKILNELTKKDINIIVVDIHAEACSEKQALARYLTGRVSLVYGTHTHCPTADERIFDGHTGFITDVGMSGAYESVTGMDIDSALKKFLINSRTKLELATEDPWFCGLIADINVSSGQCVGIHRICYRS